MPHYKDGTEAKIGDQVFGKLYNTEGVRAGTIISITPDSESCNAMVQYIEVAPYFPTEAEGKSPIPRMALHPPAPRIVKTRAHGTDGPEVALYDCADYCAINELTKVS